MEPKDAVEDEESSSDKDEGSSDEGFYYTNSDLEDQIEANEARAQLQGPVSHQEWPCNFESQIPATSSCAPTPNPSPTPPSLVLEQPTPLFTGPLALMPLFTQFSELTKEECWAYVQQLHSKGTALMDTVTSQAAQIKAADTHCTMAKHKLSTLQDQTAGKKKTKGRTMRFKAHYISHPDMKTAFEAQQHAQEEKGGERCRKAGAEEGRW
ncbi:hypothetical protein BS17DRAFT_770147 [Gyrodon lividus]|nr:hypothetical protein BS17DRAFT_770147 [Gyrodon lividus]